MPNPNAAVVDPNVDFWHDDSFGGLDTERHSDEPTTDFGNHLVKHFATPEDVAAIEAAAAAEPQPEIVTNIEALQPQPEPEPSRPENGQDEPQVYEFPDGSSYTIAPFRGGLKATLSLGGGAGPEVFYGKDQGELLNTIIQGKLNASKKIRQQNKELKTRVQPAAAAPRRTAAAPRPTVRELTVDQKFAIKTQLESDPDLAMASWFQQKTGMTIEQLIELAQEGVKEGRTAKEEAFIRDEIGAFKEEHPRFTSNDDNFYLLMGCLTKQQLNQEYPRDAEKAEEIWSTLLEANRFNRNILTEAYDSLVEDGLLELAPEEEELPVELALPGPAPVPAPASRDSAAPRTPRVASIALGVRPSQVSGQAPSPTRAPSAEELDNLPTTDINALMAQVRQSRAAARRSR